MEFEGRILRVLSVRSGTSQKGEWKTLPFVFEYFESPEQRRSDKVLLETFDHEIMGQIGKFVKRGPDGKGIYENGSAVLTGEIKCRVGFSHSVRSGNRQDGTPFNMNDIRIYKFELIQPAGNAADTAAQGQYGQQWQQGYQAQGAFAPQQAQATFPPQQQAEENDDLPF